jgi:hypothetical protein
MVRRIVAFAVAVVVMALLGSTAHSLFVQEAWLLASGPGVASLSSADRLNWILHDLVGLEPLYGSLVAVAFLVAFVAAGFVARLTGLRTVVFAVAGAVAIFVLFTVMRMQLGTVGVFGARGDLGLAAQMAAGTIAAITFALMSRPRPE